MSPIIGDIRVETSTVGDICSPDGELVVVTYSATIESHGDREKVELMTQAYRTEKLSLAPAANGTGTETPVFFPNDLSLGCHDPASPEDIYAQTGSGTMAYPHYIDLHNMIRDTVITEILDHYEVPVDTVEEMTWLNIDVDGDGDTEQVWALAKVVKKELRDSIRLDTTLGEYINPIVLIKDKVCNLLTSYSDEEFPACEGGVKILRRWNIIDWCDGTATISDYQTIEMFDVEAPIVLQPEDIVVSIDPWTCTGRAPLPYLDITDDCATEFDVKWNSKYGSIVDGYLVDLPPLDSTIVDLVVSDGCGNETVTSFQVTVVDMVQPVVVCVDNLVVTLTTGGQTGFQGVAKVEAINFDAGSHDTGCGDVTIQVIRMDDMEEYIWDCEGNEIGYKPVSCKPNTEPVDLICEKDGNQFVDAAIPGDYVSFCCEDAGQRVMVLVIVTDAHGNQNQCMIEVSVVNKGGGSLVCNTENIGCTADLDNLPAPEIVGGICADDLIVELLSESNTEIGCGEGQIIREWFIDLDASGDLSGGDGYCEQIINVDPVLSSFNPYTIKWPKHFDGTVYEGNNLECNAELDSVDTEPTTILMGDPFSCMVGTQDLIPVWCETDCGLIGYSVEPDTVVAGDACLKIINRWTVVDWCLWDANSDNVDDDNDTYTDSFVAVEDWAQGLCAECPEYGPELNDPVYFIYDKVDRDGYYTFDQVIKVIDESNPIIVLESDTIFVNSIGGIDGKIGDRNCSGSEVISASAKDFCNGVESPAEFLTWLIEIEDLDGNPINNIDGINFKNDRGPVATMNTRVGSPGDVYRIKWRAEDGCANFAFATTTVVFTDKKAPSPVCVVGLTTVFMETDGTADIWAKDFNLGSFDNCTNEEDLQFSIVLHGDDPILPDSEGFSDQASYTVFCDSILAPLVDFDMYVWDINSKGDFCTVSLAFSNGCFDEQQGNGAMISGNIQTPNGQNIESAIVNIASAMPEYPKNNMTSAEGIYSFSNNPMEQDYELAASKEDNHNNGVSTLDLVLIQKHILGISTFETAYEIIAADANLDRKVSSSDMIALRQIILGTNTELPGGNSWKFISTDYSFFDTQSPWPFVESLAISKLALDMMSEDFIGIKIGDLNESAAVNSLQTVETRSNDNLTMMIVDQNLSAGEKYQIDLKLRDFVELYGMQFTMEHHNLQIESVVSEHFDINSSNYSTNGSLTSISLSDSKAITSLDAIVSLEVEALSDVSLSNSMKIVNPIAQFNSHVVTPEAYIGQALTIYEIDLEFEENTQILEQTEFIVNQNDPNPFSARTNIVYFLPESGQVNLRIHDVTGKEMISIDNEKGQKGRNVIEFTISEKELIAGVYYYTVSSGQYSATNKMIVIE